MAYDVERKPGAWVNEQAARRSHSVYFTGGMYVAAFGLSALAWHLGQPIVALVACAALLCFAYATNIGIEVAVPWLKGAFAETAAGNELDELRCEGYIVMHDLMFGGEGNLDHLVAGPNGVFLVETKYGSYDDKHLPKIKRQAAKLASELGCWVTPVICSGVRKKTFKHQRVLIAGRGQLADAIRSQPGGRQVDHERLARFADKLD